MIPEEYYPQPGRRGFAGSPAATKRRRSMIYMGETMQPTTGEPAPQPNTQMMALDNMRKGTSPIGMGPTAVRNVGLAGRVRRRRPAAYTTNHMGYGV